MIQSVSRAIDILHIVAAAGHGIGVREIARRAELKPPTVQQLINTLRAKGLLDFDAERRQYRLGLGALLLAAAVDPMQKLVELATPFVSKLYQEFGETVVVMTFEGGHFLVVKSQASSHELTVLPPPDFLPVQNPTGMATGRMLLALLPAGERAKFVADQDVMAALDEAGEQGYCRTENVNDSGITAIAVPVCASTGQVVLSIGCSAPMQRFTEARRGEVLARLFEVAADMEQMLAGNSQPATEAIEM
jgi:DNA-binding IclR family transcriptional regulator